MKTPSFALGLFVLALAAPAAAVPPISLVPVAGGLDSVVSMTNAGDGSGRLFLILQGGRIVIFDGSTVLPTPFLDLTGQVSCCGERGLLGLAFHPHYAQNGRFYVYYTDPSGTITLARYSVSANPNVADPGSAAVLLTQAHPQTNHNGGQLQFGPDGFLYIGIGDGGGAGDVPNNAQNLGVLLGKILRIDVDGGSPYAIPASNPFVGNPAARHEIWDFGLRNPWRFSFDRMTGELIIGDVGQDTEEEVDAEPPGGGGRNYGWRRMEGTLCFNPSTGCNDGTLTLPVLEYDHSLGCAITGGYRYRGLSFPSLDGVYLYGDFCSGRLWGATESAGTWSTEPIMDSPYSISTFGEDERGHLYLADYQSSGTLLRVDSTPFVRGDLDQDGHVDLVWQKSDTGVVAGMLMDGVTATSAAVLAAPTDPAWHVVGVHDFDGDGQTDLLLEHASLGALAVVFYDLTVPRTIALLTPAVEPDLDWQVVGTADLDLDGHPDLVWRNRADGRLRAWLMDGTTRLTEVALDPGQLADTSWKVAAVEDVSGDGRPDLVWQRDDGEVMAWVMKGTHQTDVRTMFTVADARWRIRAGGDFGNTSDVDLVWRHMAPDGGLVATFLKGTTAAGSTLLVPPAVTNPLWDIVGPR
jgi:glucose/arabinose dehydrogenase